MASRSGSTIITTVLQILRGVVEEGLPLEAAVARPRIHHQWLPDRMSIEEGGASPEAVARLEAMGHTVRVGGRQGSAHSIMIDPRTGERLGAADPRDRDAGAVGY